MEWFKRFMNGRYGGDQLSMVLLLLSITFTIISRLTKMPLIALIGYIPMGISVFRMFSKDTAKRSMENYKFAIFISPIYSRYHKLMSRIKDSKTHKYFKCPNCKQKLRLPKGKGKIIVTCSKCRTKFNKRT